MQVAQANHERVDEVLIGRSGTGFYESNTVLRLGLLRPASRRREKDAQPANRKELAPIHHLVTPSPDNSPAILLYRCEAMNGHYCARLGRWLKAASDATLLGHTAVEDDRPLRGGEK